MSARACYHVLGHVIVRLTLCSSYVIGAGRGMSTAPRGGPWGLGGGGVDNFL